MKSQKYLHITILSVGALLLAFVAARFWYQQPDQGYELLPTIPPQTIQQPLNESVDRQVLLPATDIDQTFMTRSDALLSDILSVVEWQVSTSTRFNTPGKEYQYVFVSSDRDSRIQDLMYYTNTFAYPDTLEDTAWTNQATVTVASTTYSLKGSVAEGGRRPPMPVFFSTDGTFIKFFFMSSEHTLSPNQDFSDDDSYIVDATTFKLFVSDTFLLTDVFATYCNFVQGELITIEEWFYKCR